MRHINIIIAEDQLLFSELLSKDLKRHKIYTIGKAGNGLELLELLRNQLPDVVLLDIEMPVMNGVQALKKIKQLYPHLHVITMSMYNDASLNKYLLKQGARECLNKSMSTAEIAANIVNVYSNRPIKTASTEKTQTKGLHITAGEYEIIRLLCKGLSNKEMAEKLNVCLKTIEARKKTLFNKTNSQNAMDCLRFLQRTGLQFVE